MYKGFLLGLEGGGEEDGGEEEEDEEEEEEAEEEDEEEEEEAEEEDEEEEEEAEEEEEPLAFLLVISLSTPLFMSSNAFLKIGSNLDFCMSPYSRSKGISTTTKTRG